MYRKNDGMINSADIINAIKNVGIKEGDAVFIHSDISIFGKLINTDRHEFLSDWVNIIRQVIKDGTVIMPTFTYSFCNDEIFDVNQSKSRVGVLTEFFRKYNGVKRTEHPIFSVAVLGEKDYIDVSMDSFGIDSIFDKLKRHHGKILILGSSFETSATFLHYIEQTVGVPYRYMKTFSGIIRKNGEERRMESNFYVRDLDMDIRLELNSLKSYLLEHNIAKQVFLGNGEILSIDAYELFEHGCKLIRQDKYFFVEQGIINVDNLPYYYGVTQNKDILFPENLSFSLVFNDNMGLITQEPNDLVNDCNEKAYKLGSSLSTPLDEGSFGNRFVEDFISVLNKCIKKDINGMSFLEIGCNTGYLLYKLKQLGAKRVLGVTPDPISQVTLHKYNIDIIQDFFMPDTIKGKFDVIFTHGVLEHIQDVVAFLKQIRNNLSEDGIILNAVPDCEEGLNIGDITLLAHQHYNYFTQNSLCNIYNLAEFSDNGFTRAGNGWMLYGWAKPSDKNNISLADKELFYRYRRKFMYVGQRLQELINKHKLSIYGVCPNILMYNWPYCPVFYDTDIAKHGRYISGCDYPIRDPKEILEDNPEAILIMPIHYDKEIFQYVKSLGIKSKLISYKSICEGV